MSGVAANGGRLRPPRLGDGAALWALVAATRPPFRLFRVLGTGLLTGLRQPVPPSPLVSGRDYANRLQAFQGFARGASGGGGGGASFVELWRDEGLGYRLGAGSLADGAPRPLETLSRHTGAGLAVAQAAVEQRPRVAACVESFRGACAEMAGVGYEQAMLEALGLAVQLFAPARLREFDAELESVAPQMRPLLWHGAGRGLYFSPWSLILGGSSDWRCIEDARDLAPHDLALDNLLAGLSWAVTLVNLRSPQVLASFIAAMGRRYPQPGPLVDGLRSAMWLWRRWNPASDIEAALRRELTRRRGKHPSSWDDLVTRELWSERNRLSADAPPGSVFGYHAWT